MTINCVGNVSVSVMSLYFENTRDLGFKPPICIGYHKKIIKQINTHFP